MLNRFEEKVKKIEEFVNALNNFDKTLKDIGTIFVFHSSEKMLHNLPYFLFLIMCDIFFPLGLYVNAAAPPSLPSDF